MFEKLKALFATEPPAPPIDSTAYSDGSMLYGAADFIKYNPDSLIGRKGYNIYSKMMLDEQVKAIIKFKRDAITGRDYFFDMPGEEVTNDEKKRRIDIFEKILAEVDGSFIDVLNTIMAASYQGYSISEKLFKQIEYKGLVYWGIRTIRKKPFETFYFTVDEFGEITKLEQKIGARNIELDLDKFVHFVINPDVDPHYGQSELREAYRSWWSKDNILKFWNIWLERSAGGLTIVKPEKGVTLQTNSQQHLDLVKALNNLSVKSYLILPPGIDAKSEFPSNQIAYKDAVAHHNTAMAKALLVPNLLGVTEQNGYGSYSQSSTQLEAFFWTLDADAVRLEEALNEQVFKSLGELNFGDGLYPKFRFKPVSNSMKLEIVTKWKDLVQGGAVEASDTDEEHIRDLMDFPEKGEPIAKVSPPLGWLTGPSPGNPKPPPVPDGGDLNKPPGQTILGEKTVVIDMAKAVAAAQARVNFNRIDEKSNELIDDNVDGMSKLFLRMIQDALGQIKDKKIGVNGGDLDLSQLKMPAFFVSAARKMAKKALASSWNLGSEEALHELQMATKKKFAAEPLYGEIASKYFESRAFEMAGNFTDESRKIITNILQQGVKYGKPVSVIEREVYEAFSNKGYLSISEIKDALGETLSDATKTITAETAASRLRTVLKTSVFEALNEARFDRFTDPDVSDYVEALQYSAIMDSRTTKEICRKLDDMVLPVDSELWNKYRPPNHFNCRAIVIPVVAGEKWEASEDPQVSIPEGFG